MPSVNDLTIPVYAGSIGSWKISVSRRPLGGYKPAERYHRNAAKWSCLTERLGYPKAYERLLGEFIREAELPASREPIRVLDCVVGTGTLLKRIAHVRSQ